MSSRPARGSRQTPRPQPDLATLKSFPARHQDFIVQHAAGPDHQSADPAGHRRGRQCRRHHGGDRLLAQAQSSMLYPGEPVLPGRHAPKPWYDRKDPEKAKELLKQAGYKGEKMVLETNSNYAYMRNSILVLAEQMKAAGMNVDVQMVDWTTNPATCSRAPATGTSRPPASAPGRCSGRSSGRDGLYLPAYRQGSGDRWAYEVFTPPTGGAKGGVADIENASSTRPT